MNNSFREGVQGNRRFPDFRRFFKKIIFKIYINFLFIQNQWKKLITR